jgi:hypothetical protein
LLPLSTENNINYLKFSYRFSVKLIHLEICFFNMCFHSQKMSVLLGLLLNVPLHFLYKNDAKKEVSSNLPTSRSEEAFWVTSHKLL